MTFAQVAYLQRRNHWHLEPDLPFLLCAWWPDFTAHLPELEAFGQLVGDRAYPLGYHIDRLARPVLVNHDLDGRRVDRVHISPEHAELLRRMAFINRPPYEGSTWLHHYALGYLLADPGLYCSLIVTNQTAYALHKYAPHLSAWRDALLRGEAWGATWMTETQGGSDLGANRTRAERTAQGWRLYGTDKYFASNAGLADYALVTARPAGAPPGPKGLALFVVPRLDEAGNLNYLVRRLKDKSATRAVPTGEVEFHGSQAYLIGQAELGIYYTLENLTVSRLANAVGALGVARKAHLEALFRARERHAFGRPIAEHPLLQQDLLDMRVRIAGGLALTFYTIAAFDRVWQQQPPYGPDYHAMRFLSHLTKNRTAEHGAAVTQLAMEVFGGVGFLEEYAVARLHREALVTLIWEGTSNIQALDMLEAVHKKGVHEAYLDELEAHLAHADRALTETVRRAVNGALRPLVEAESPAAAQWYAKDALRTLADGLAVALLASLAARTDTAAYADLASLYAERFLAHRPYPAWAARRRELWYPPEVEAA